MSGEVRSAAERYFSEVTLFLRAVDLSSVERVVDILREARRRDAAVYLVGNGGSAATSSHFAVDLVNAARYSGGPAFRVFSLTDSSACLTGLSNDEGYDRVFAVQLENCLRRGDVLVAISASGNSPNILRAVEVAKAAGAVTVGMVGFDGGSLGRLVDEAILVPSPVGAYGPVEDVHLILEHLISACAGQAAMSSGVLAEALEECVA